MKIQVAGGVDELQYILGVHSGIQLQEVNPAPLEVITSSAFIVNVASETGENSQQMYAEMEQYLEKQIALAYAQTGIRHEGKSYVFGNSEPGQRPLYGAPLTFSGARDLVEKVAQIQDSYDHLIIKGHTRKKRAAAIACALQEMFTLEGNCTVGNFEDMNTHVYDMLKDVAKRIFTPVE